MNAHASGAAGDRAPIARKACAAATSAAGAIEQATADSVRELIAAARAFWLIPELIPQPSRDGVALLYCFCRRLDDAVDEAPDAAQAREALSAFRDELHGRRPPRPLIAAFLADASRSGVPLACAEFLLDGMDFDLGRVRFAGDGELLRYCYRVSSSVALLVAPLIGVRGREAEARFVDLGLALQLSNIILGVAGDARRGRVYLPASRLAREGLAAEDVLRDPESPRLRPVLQGLARLADRYYESVEQGAALVPLRYRHGVMLLYRVYGDIAWAVARGELAPPATRFPLSFKLRGITSLLRDGWRPRTLGLLPAPPHDPALHRAIAGWPGADRNAVATSPESEL